MPPFIRSILLGPFVYRPRSCVLLIAAIVLLTLLTQIGGVVLWIFLPIFAAATAAMLAYLVAYGIVTVAVVPPLAKSFGRRPLPCVPSPARPYGASSVIYCAANRHYAVPRLHRTLVALAVEMRRRFPDATVRYLDAGFPFLNGFPLLPHLSHDDGRKIDLAFFYVDASTGRPVPDGGAWPIGYWAYSPPAAGEPAPCAAGRRFPSLRWDFGWLQPAFADRRLDRERTAAMVRWLAGPGRSFGVGKVLLEPHLTRRLGVASPIVRFQGCRAARHDDHMHVELRRPARN